MAATAAIMSSCSKNEVVENPTNPANAIGFSTYVGNSTKAGNSEIYTTTTMQGTGFGVLGYYTKQVAFADAKGGAETTPNFMYNQKVEYDNSLTTGETQWWYTPIKYYSNTANDKYSFFAYAPYDAADTDNGIELSANNVKDTPSIKFTLADVDKLVDFVATQKIDEVKPTTADDPIDLLFKHQLTRLSFSAETDYSLTGNYGQTNTYVVIRSMKILVADEFWKSATYTFATTNDTNGTWSYDSGKATAGTEIDFSSLLNSITPTTSTSPTYDEMGGYDEPGVYVNNNKSSVSLFSVTGADKKYLFLIPADGLASDEFKVEIEYDIVTVDKDHLDDKHAASSNTTTVSLPASTMQQGVAYNYTLIFGLDEVVVSATVDDTWGSGSGDITIN